jgi:hypothetical protein
VVVAGQGPSDIPADHNIQANHIRRVQVRPNWQGVFPFERLRHLRGGRVRWVYVSSNSIEHIRYIVGKCFFFLQTQCCDNFGALILISVSNISVEADINAAGLIFLLHRNVKDPSWTDDAAI